MTIEDAKIDLKKDSKKICIKKIQAYIVENKAVGSSKMFIKLLALMMNVKIRIDELKFIQFKERRKLKAIYLYADIVSEKLMNR